MATYGLLIAKSNEHFSVLIHLDLSAAFDSAEHFSLETHFPHSF